MTKDFDQLDSDIQAVTQALSRIDPFNNPDPADNLAAVIGKLEAWDAVLLQFPGCLGAVLTMPDVQSSLHLSLTTIVACLSRVAEDLAKLRLGTN